MPCACAGKCWLCSDGDGRVVDRVATHFWNDFAAVRIDIRRGPRTVAVHPSQPPSYGRLREEPPPDVATPVPGPSMLFVETGRSTESTRALVEITTVRGILLVQPRKRAGTRLYRSGQRVLVVRDLEPGETDRRADFVDAIHGRSLTFLDLEEARRRHRILARVASELPDLPAVEAFVKSR